MTPLLVGAGSVAVAAGLLFANVEVGATIPNPILKDREGVARSLVDPEKPTAFLFFDPHKPRCLEVMGAMADLQKDLEDVDIVWVGVVSDRFSPESVKAALDGSGIHLDIVIDPGDRFYGELGVRLYPTVGIADSTGTLRAYLPYTKVNYTAALEAHLRNVLGQITDEELQQALDPTEIEINSNEIQAGRNLKFARMLWHKGKQEKALSMARKAVEIAPDLAEAHAAVGGFLVEMGQCDESSESLRRALEIEPDNAEALAALSRCGQDQEGEETTPRE